MRNTHKLIIALLFLLGCNEAYTPKPRAYFRINFPDRGYQVYDSNCNFTFSYPTYAEVIHDLGRNSEPCWLNILYKPFRAKLHMSYKELDGSSDIMELLEESRSLVYKHTIKAQEITENIIRTDSNTSGMFYELEGNTASAVQFYLTDSTKNYIRGALYFSAKSNRDSLQPVIEFLRVDIEKLINTLKWKDDV